jgi:hypothetical protein
MKSRLNKVILVDDTHTNLMWDELANDFRAAGVTVEHDELPRLKEQKSLVDMRMVAKAMEEYYKNGRRAFILATSDSDIWALITSMPEAKILVLAEQSKCGDVLIEALTQANIKRVFMEEIAEDTTELMDRIMYQKIESMLVKQNIDIRRIVINAAQKLNLFLEKEVIDKYTKDIMAEIISIKDKDAGVVRCSMEA